MKLSAVEVGSASEGESRSRWVSSKLPEKAAAPMVKMALAQIIHATRKGLTAAMMDSMLSQCEAQHW
jgi:hypothetical protein